MLSITIAFKHNDAGDALETSLKAGDGAEVASGVGLAGVIVARAIETGILRSAKTAGSFCKALPSSV